MATNFFRIGYHFEKFRNQVTIRKIKINCTPCTPIPFFFLCYLGWSTYVPSKELHRRSYAYSWTTNEYWLARGHSLPKALASESSSVKTEEDFTKKFWNDLRHCKALHTLNNTWGNRLVDQWIDEMFSVSEVPSRNSTSKSFLLFLLICIDGFIQSVCC